MLGESSGSSANIELGAREGGIPPEFVRYLESWLRLTEPCIRTTSGLEASNRLRSSRLTFLEGRTDGTMLAAGLISLWTSEGSDRECLSSSTRRQISELMLGLP